MSHWLDRSSCLDAGEIQRYLDGEADDALRFRVENHLADCPLCSAAVEAYAAAGHAGRIRANEEIEELRYRVAERTEEVPRRRNSLFNWAAAAAVLIILGVSGWLYRDHTRDERLFAAVFQPAESEYLALRGNRPGFAPAELKLALELYEAGDFEAGLPHFRAYLSENPDDFDAALYAGIAALEAGQTEQALVWLESARFNNPEQYAPATWYLALTHLRRNDHGECAALLKELQAGEDPGWGEKAGILLHKLPLPGQE